VDIYFDNVGGEISDAVFYLLNKFARIVICGVISHYNEKDFSFGPRIQSLLLGKSSIMQGFNVDDYAALFPVASIQLVNWLREGKLAYAETIVKGFDNIPLALLDLFEGKNEGKR